MPEIPPAISVSNPAPADPPVNFTADFLSLLRVLLARNPFYIISAMLLLWSMRQLSLDSRIFHDELPQLLFNYSSFQFYEWLLVGTAILLARRRVWYDSGLLVALENLFVCVPFLLVSQALLLENSTATVLCVSGGALALVRGYGLRRKLKEMNLSAAWLWAGVGLLAFNLAWPVLVRSLHKEVDLPVWDRRGLLLTALEWNWLVPGAAALAGLLPMREFAFDTHEGEEKPFYAWRVFPVVVLLMWMAGTAVHLYSISYVYGLPWRMALLAPAFWVASWIVWRRWNEFFPGKWRVAERFLLLTPALAVLMYAHAGRPLMCLTLGLLNTLIYALLVFVRRDRMARYLTGLSALVSIYFMPHPVGINPGLSLGEFLGCGTFVFLVGWAMVSRRPGIGILGGVCLGLGMAVALPMLLPALNFSILMNISMQAAWIFILLHSMRWDPESKDHARARAMCAAYWLIHSSLWIVGMPETAPVYTTAIGASVVMVFVCARFVLGRWPSTVIGGSGVVVGLVGPAYLLAERIAHAPQGVLTLLGSFALFGLGTLAALMKSKWMPKRDKATVYGLGAKN